jgi:hypothetical protein
MERDERNLEAVPAHLRSTDDTASENDSRDPRIAKRTSIERFSLDVFPTDFSSMESAGPLVCSAAIGLDTKKQQAAKKYKLSLLQDDGQYIAEPGVFDVLLGRGKPIQENPGNKILRQIVDFHSRSYLCAARKDKKGIAQEIVLAMKANGNRFLRQNDVTECWEEVDNEVAKEKVCHCFRSQAARRVRSSSSSPQPLFSSNSSAPAAACFPQTYTAAVLSGGPIVQFPLHAMEQQKNSHALTMAISPSTTIPLTQKMTVGSTATTSSFADQGPSTAAQRAMQYPQFLAPNNALGASTGLPSTMNAGRLLLGGNINPFPSQGRPSLQPDQHAVTMQPLFPATYLDAASSSAKTYWDHQTYMLHSKDEGADDAR